MEEQTGIAFETVEDLANCNLPRSGEFTKEITSPFKTRIDKFAWQDLISNHLNSSGTKKYFNKGSWQHIMLPLIKEGNPYCSILFKRHLVYNHDDRKARTNILFSANAYCKHENCGAKNISIKITDDMMFTVTFDTNLIRHSIGELASRPISGINRQNESKRLGKGRVSASVEYAKRMQDMDDDVFVSGNRDDMGISTSVLRQIIHECRRNERLDTSELDSLLRLKTKYDNQDTGKHEIKGFIQIISVDPVILFLWTRAAVKVFHDVCQMDAVFWDATGQIVKSRMTTRKLFYYELTVGNPTTRKTSLPIAMMISSSQTQPTIQYWLSTFRNHEKAIYGADKISRPVQINSDRAMVFIVSALQIFNGESFQEFLKRTWKIVNGKAELGDLQKTIVHTCAFHYMRNVKDLVKTNYKAKGKSVGIWILSLLMNAETLQDIDDIVNLAIVVTSSKSTSKRFFSCVGTLNKRLRNFKADISAETKKSIEGVVSDVVTQQRKRKKETTSGTEEQLYHLSKDSPFKKHFSDLYTEQMEMIKKEDAESKAGVNALYSEGFFQAVLKQLIPTIPLWSGLLLGDLSRHGPKIAPYMSYKSQQLKHPRTQHTFDDSFTGSNRTTGISEKRMGDLYNSLLGGKQAARLDDLVIMLHENVLGMQRIFADSVTSRMRPTSKAKVLRESWDKRRGKAKAKLSYQKGTKKDETINIANVEINQPEEENPQSSSDDDFCESVPKKTKTTNVTKSRISSSDIDFSQSVPKKSKIKVTENRTSNKTDVKKSKTKVTKRTTNRTFSPTARQPAKKKPKQTAGLDCFERNLFKGLSNQSNTCWFNSSMTAFLNTYGSFKAFDCPQADRNMLLHRLYQVIKHLNVCTEPERLEANQLDSILNDYFRVNNHNFQIGTQEDAAEFIHELTMNLDYSIENPDLFDQNNTFVDEQIYNYKSKQFVSCLKCGKQSDQDEDGDRIIAVSLDTCVGQSTVADLVDAYFEDELLEGYTCDSCNSQNSAMARKITSAPRVIMINLKRYEAQSKRTKSILPSKSLNISHHVIGTVINTTYKLRSVIQPKGLDLHSEHYTTLIYENGNVYELDDKIVSKLSNTNEVNEECYIFLYEDQEKISSATSLWLPLTFVLLAIRSKIKSGSSRLALLLDSTWNEITVENPALKRCEYMIYSIAGQLARQLSSTRICINKVLMDGGVLIRQLLSVIGADSDAIIKIQIMEEATCNNCDMVKRAITSRDDIQCKTLSSTSLKAAFHTLKPAGEYRCCQYVIPGKSVRCSPIYLPCFIVILNQGPIKENTITINRTGEEAGECYSVKAVLEGDTVTIYSRKDLFTLRNQKIASVPIKSASAFSGHNVVILERIDAVLFNHAITTQIVKEGKDKPLHDLNREVQVELDLCLGNFCAEEDMEDLQNALHTGVISENIFRRSIRSMTSVDCKKCAFANFPSIKDFLSKTLEYILRSLYGCSCVDKEVDYIFFMFPDRLIIINNLEEKIFITGMFRINLLIGIFIGIYIFVN